MKPYEREEARRLRREEGRPVKEICQKLGVAKSSVSLWVRNVELTEEQKAGLKCRHPMYHGQHKGSRTNDENLLESIGIKSSEGEFFTRLREQKIIPDKVY